MRKTLDLLAKNQKAIICDFDLDQVPLKLLEMGCLPGNEVQLLEIAPLGDPMLLCINETHLSIRKELAKQIQIETER